MGNAGDNGALQPDSAREALRLEYRREVEGIAEKIRLKILKGSLSGPGEVADEALQWVRQSPRSWQAVPVIETLLCTERPLAYLSGPLGDPVPCSPFEAVAKAANRAFVDDIVEAVKNPPGRGAGAPRRRGSDGNGRH